MKAACAWTAPIRRNSTPGAGCITGGRCAKWWPSSAAYTGARCANWRRWCSSQGPVAGLAPRFRNSNSRRIPGLRLGGHQLRQQAAHARITDMTDVAGGQAGVELLVLQIPFEFGQRRAAIHHGLIGQPAHVLVVVEHRLRLLLQAFIVFRAPFIMISRVKSLTPASPASSAARILPFHAQASNSDRAGSQGRSLRFISAVRVDEFWRGRVPGGAF